MSDPTPYSPTDTTLASEVRFTAESFRPRQQGRRSLSRRVKAFMEPRLIYARGHVPPPRVLPDFIIIGARKGGTTFLYNNLVRQRGFLPAYKKEVQFFDKFYGNGPAWYRAHFPTTVAMGALGLMRGRPAITGESTPLYLFHPKAPERVQALMPQARLIVLLRNPVDRAYSHYEHQARRNVGAKSFEEALESEAIFQRGQAAQELRLLMTRDDYISEPRQVLSYLSGGVYVDQLRGWYQRFRPERILVIQSEEMYRDTMPVLERVTEFLGGEPQSVKIARENRKRGYPKMNPDTRKRLEDYFAPHNARLYRFLAERGVAFTPWEQ